MRTALYVLLALAAPALAGQTVYKWVDEKGVTHYSDQPVAGAEKVELKGGANRSSAPAPTYAPPPARETTTSTRKETGPAYSRFVITSPQQDEAIINTGGVVRVEVAATPPLDAGHRITYYLDGAQVSDANPNSMSHEFKDMPRGTHTVKAAVSTVQGATIQETPTVTFHVRQQSIAQPPVGPTLRNNNSNNNRPRRIGNKLPTEQPTYAALNGSKPRIDPRTNMPVDTKPKSQSKPKSEPKAVAPKAPKTPKATTKSKTES
jgi:hypothetical protein